MNKAGILFVLFLFGGCFQFIFKRKRQRSQDRSRKGHVDDNMATTPQQSRRVTNEQGKATRTFHSRASHFSRRPQNLSEEDKLWLQAFRYGAR